jgi:hypothetical protein
MLLRETCSPRISAHVSAQRARNHRTAVGRRQVTKEDMVKMIPVAFCSAAAHSFSVFALSAGAVSFGQVPSRAFTSCASL